MGQNFCLFHVSNLSVRDFLIFLLMYTGPIRRLDCDDRGRQDPVTRSVRAGGRYAPCSFGARCAHFLVAFHAICCAVLSNARSVAVSNRCVWFIHEHVSIFLHDVCVRIFLAPVLCHNIKLTVVCKSCVMSASNTCFMQQTPAGYSSQSD